ncbi:MAG: phage BR0599 family protein [Nocardioides sp.]
MTATVDLYRIVLGTVTYTMTSGDDPIEHGSGAAGALELYVPTAIGRGGIQSRSEMAKANLEVRLPLGHDLAAALLSSWLERICTITVFRRRTASTDTVWKGRLTAANPDDTNIKMNFESIFTSMRRPGLRARFQKTCRHPLYGRGCYLDPENFAYAAALSAIDGRTLTVPAAAGQANGFFTGGMVKAPDGTLTFISEHSGTQLVMNRVSGALSGPLALSGPGVAITIYPGCNHSYAECASKFANDDNYGGFDYIPTKSPVGGMSIV